MSKEPFRVLVCGGRDFTDYYALAGFLDELFHGLGLEYEPDEYGNTLPGYVHIIAGGARGADRCAIDYAVCRWLAFTEYHADWKKHGKAAGTIRNQLMLEDGQPDLVVAFPGGRGTADMVRRARAAGVEVILALQKTKAAPAD